MIKSRPMFLRLFPRHLLASLLMAALLLQSLLPALAGLRQADGTRWVEVCAGSGIRWVKADLARADQTADMPADLADLGDGHGDHCALCAVTGPVPEFDASHYLPAAQAAIARLPQAAAPVTAFPGHALRSRAPPIFS